MLGTKQTVAEKIAAYLHHEMTLAQLMEWAGNTMMDGGFEEQNLSSLRNVISRLGAVAVRAFGLTWEDCEPLLKQLGFSACVDIIAA